MALLLRRFSARNPPAPGRKSKSDRLLATLYSTGLRLAELVNLTIADIDSHAMIRQLHETHG